MTEPLCSGTKHCPRCDRDLWVLAFASKPDKRDGLQSWCRDCTAEADRAADKRRRWKRSGRSSKHSLRLGALDVGEVG